MEILSLSATTTTTAAINQLEKEMGFQGKNSGVSMGPITGTSVLLPIFDFRPGTDFE